jgi:hypothetical protein
MEAVNFRHRMFNFDELKVAYEPPPGVTFAPVASGDASIPSEGKGHQNFTLGLCTTAAGDKLIPMFIFTGAMQLCDGPLVEIEINDGYGGKTMATAFVSFTSSHYNNQWLYVEYFNSCIAPNFPTHDCCDDPECMSTLFLHDDAPMHWTQEVKQAIESHRGVKNLKVPNTKYVQPNDYNINKQMEAFIGAAQRDFLAARAVAKR